MLPKKTTDIYCEYPRVPEDSVYHFENCVNSPYMDSIRNYYDSLKLDYMPSGKWARNDEGVLEQIWIPKVGKLIEENLDYIGYQDYIVPTFFSLITVVLIFGLIVIRDSKKGEKEKGRESILDLMSNEDS